MRLSRWNVRPLLHSTLAALVVLATPMMAQAQQATVSGRVTASTGEPLAEARVQVVNTSIAAPTNADGRYTLRGVPTGAIEIRVIRVGFAEQKKAVTVSAGGTATLDFQMAQAIVKLQEIVTTATGEQRRVEIGNAVTTFGDVTAKVETQPVSNIADLLVGKAPGVTVLPGAMTGSAPTVRIRGLGSLATTGSGVTNNPIYVIDGVRMNSGTINLSSGGTTGSFLNDLDPNEIEDIEIVKGPSAATLYGTDAANGVIVITTRKGKAGATKWTYWGEDGTVDDRNKYPIDYASWGHNAAGAVTRCTLVSESLGTCTLDSLTSFSVLTNPSTTPNVLGNHRAGGMNASGGSEQVRFFVSGDLQNEIGPVKMPAFAQLTLDSLGAGARDEWTHPEALQVYSARANVSAALSPKFDLNVNAGFNNTNQRIPQVDNNTFSYLYSALNNPGFNHNGLGYNELGSLGEYRNGYGGFSPAQIFQRVDENGTQRFIGSGDATWRPFDWMQNQATTGIDLANNDFTITCRLNECPNSGTTRQGIVSQNHSNIRNFSAKLVSTSTWQARSNANFKTTFGADYTNLENDGVNATGQNLPPGAQTIGAAATQTAGNTLQTVNKTLGVYAQEQLSLRDRMFLTVAARSDQNSSFGTQFQKVFYPKESISWILSDESFFPHPEWLNSFRLREAYGASGVQPGGTVALQTFQSSTQNVALVPGSATSADTPGLLANALGNPALKPERSAEFEGGFESSIFSNHIHVDLTYYSKKTSDALISVPIAASSGASALSVLKNSGSVSNSGLELTLNTTLIDRRALGWDVTVGASHNSNKVLSLGNDATGKPNVSIGTTLRDSVGLPVNAQFGRAYTYSDLNHDGIITPNEVVVDTNGTPGTVNGLRYYGYTQPRDIVSITNGFDLFSHKLRITVLTDYRGGFLLNNQSGSFFVSNFPTWYSENLKSTPLWDQARSVAASSAKNPSTSTGYLENGQFWKLRELSAALSMPTALAQKLRARDLQLVFTARNLHTWTSYTGVDPEEAYISGSGDVQNDFATTAPRTYFTLRANLHY